jgi:hypothetical protein
MPPKEYRTSILLSFDATIEIKGVSDFIKLSGQEARMSGRVFYYKDHYF